ncbi:Calx-beta domain-containing protein [Halochromatium glycolicum]|uniref:Calx-beta domain-containing protein n=1 Tax=Halochromatium glycolicum TaxID=85075 RepID=UPI001F5B9169|nr:Calx-beta domain-containing protein [Halochromatium glycolicum]
MLNSTFGELAGWQRVSAQQEWIDQNLRAQLPGAPTRPAEIEQRVVEGDYGTHYAYSLLSFNGTREEPSSVLSVDYATRDGSATAGTDYLAVEGTLNLYPGEDQAVIPVEIIGDRAAEPDEVFYLDVTNPVGGVFPGGAVQLTAVRTIVDDDGLF